MSVLFVRYAQRARHPRQRDFLDKSDRKSDGHAEQRVKITPDTEA